MGGKLRRFALGIHPDRLGIAEIEGLYVGKGVDADVLGAFAVVEIDAHDAVGNVGQGELRIVDGRLPVRDGEFEHPAAQHVLRPVPLGEEREVVLGECALGVHDDDVADVAVCGKIGDGKVDLLRRDADAGEESDAHEDHQHDGDETGDVAAEHPPKCLEKGTHTFTTRSRRWAWGARCVRSPRSCRS